MKVESKLIVIALAATGGFSAAASPSRLPTWSVWLRNVSGLVPASIGSTLLQQVSRDSIPHQC
jgi:hypothetical protein